MHNFMIYWIHYKQKRGTIFKITSCQKRREILSNSAINCCVLCFYLCDFISDNF